MTTRTHKDLEETQTAEKHREFMQALLVDLRALERMLAEGHFESGIQRIGAEQEMFIVDSTWGPTRGIFPLLERLGGSHYTTELAQFQIEANCDPQLLGGDGIARLHAQLDQLVDDARSAARELDMNVVLMGILPTLRKTDLGLDNMVPSPRYQALNKIVTDLRGGKFSLSIKGLDELIIDHDSVMVEACNSSFQVHLQISPGEFARMYNIAQVLTGPLMSVSANSPIAFGRRLWAETRIGLFRQAVDTRNPAFHLRETEARVSFGTRWVKSSVAEIYQEDIARFRTLVGTDLDEDPMAVLDAGGIPLLKALRLHNGTIYRWNRPCFGVTDGKAHLRIENRIMPAGPSTIDQIANGAFWFGMMNEFGASGDDITRRIDFDQAGNNFYIAAREGLGAHFEWLDGQQISAQRLVLDQLLPMAEAGLNRAGVEPTDIRKYLDIVEERARTGRTGASWQFRSWNSLRDRGTPGERANALVAATVKRQLTGRPVAQWERARLDEAYAAASVCHRVEQYMRTDLFTVHPDDPVEILANLMIWERIRFIPVEDRNHQLLGLVSYREVLQLLTGPRNLRRTSVEDVMIEVAQLHTVNPETSTAEAIQLLKRYRTGCLPVVQDGRLVGIVSEEEFVGVANKLLGPELEDDDK
ncbi:MAG: CBS domain-containing protein [Bradymonadaceae bacterium]|nr:CBS domain-containing protein [Lujinxingiaceae bacterium]